MARRTSRVSTVGMRQDAQAILRDHPGSSLYAPFRELVGEGPRLTAQQRKALGELIEHFGVTLFLIGEALEDDRLDAGLLPALTDGKALLMRTEALFTVIDDQAPWES